MKKNQFSFLMAGIVLIVSAFSGCKKTSEGGISKIKMNCWQYNADDDVYYQTGISYAANPTDEKYETLGLFVPGKYFTGTKNSDGTYSVKINKNGEAGGFTIENAPYVLPIETPGYSAMNAPSGYSSAVKEFTDNGFIFIYSGARGRDQGAPSGVTDFKAAIRYVRYCKDLLPGDTEKIFTYGMSGGGAQSAILGASGNSELYIPYLQAIGAVMNESDAVYGSMDWCPVTNLNVADEAYEWELAASRTDMDDFTKQLSDGLAEAFAIYINQLGLKDENGNVLTLSETDNGIYQSGSYYDYLMSVIEGSLNKFLAEQSFPYDPAEQKSHTNMAMMAMPDFMKQRFGDVKMEDLKIGDDGKPVLPEGGKGPEMGRPGDGKGPGDMKGPAPDGKAPDGMKAPDGKGPAPDGMKAPEGMDFGPDGMPGFEAMDNVQRNVNSAGVTISGVYQTVQDYIDALNSKGTWVIYDADTNTAKITSLADFSKAVKNATKSVGAFDDLNATQGENTLFGYNDGKGAHFDYTEAGLLKGTDYEAAFTSDLAKTDALGKSIQDRMNMYNPMYYLSSYYEGAGSSKVANFWRIRTGIFQGDTAVSTEMDLALALKNSGVENVDFETVWGLAHVQAETEGTPSANFIAWVKDCLSK